MGKIKHKHLTKKEIMEFIKNKGKNKEIDKRIRECKICYAKFNYLYYKYKFLKEVKNAKN